MVLARVAQVVMTLTIVVVVAFKTSTRLGLAYGLAVNCDLLLTSCFLILVCTSQLIYNSSSTSSLRKGHRRATIVEPYFTGHLGCRVVFG